MKVNCSHSIIEKIVVAIGIVIILYISYVTIDCFRLYYLSNKNDTKPMITIHVNEYETENEKRKEYTGLGYSMKYYRTILYRRRIYGNIWNCNYQ